MLSHLVCTLSLREAMAVRIVAILAAAWVSCVSSATPALRATPSPASTEGNTTNVEVSTSTAAKSPCSGDDGLVNMIVAISPECFDRCQYLCGALEAMLPEVLAGPDPEAIERQVCMDKDEYECAFQADNLAVCQGVLSAGAEFKVPQTGIELNRRCGALLGMHRDMNEDNSTMSSAWPWATIKATVMLVVCMAHML